MKLGAADFVTKPVNHQQLIDRIQEVLRHAELQRSVKGIAIEPQIARARLESLTPREKEIFQRITAGASNKAIAYELGISVRTVETHRANIMEKLEARTVVDLVQLALSL
jgi:FixJ family two-component response regulator